MPLIPVWKGFGSAWILLASLIAIGGLPPAATQSGSTTAVDYRFSSVIAHPASYDGRITSYGRSVEPGSRITALASDGLYLFFASAGFPYCTIGRVPLLLPISEGDLTECLPGQERPTSVAVSTATNELFVTVSTAPASVLWVVLEPVLKTLASLVVFESERPVMMALAVDATRELLVIGSQQTAADAEEVTRIGSRVYKLPLTDAAAGDAGGITSLTPPPFRGGARAKDFPYVDTPSSAGSAMCAVLHPSGETVFLGTATGAMLRIRLAAFATEAVDVFPGVGGSFPLVAVVFDAAGSSVVFATLSEPSLLPQVFLQQEDEPSGYRNITIPAYEGSYSRVVALGIDAPTRRVIVGTSSNFASIAMASLESGVVQGPLRSSGAGHALLSALLPAVVGGYVFIGTGTSLSRMRIADLFPETEMSQSAALQPRAPVALVGVGDGTGRWLTMHKGTAVSTAQMVRYNSIRLVLAEDGVNSVFVTGTVRSFTVAPKRDLAYVVITSMDSASGPIIIFIAMRTSDLSLVGGRALPLPTGTDLDGLVCERCAITTADGGHLVLALALSLTQLDVALITFENNAFEIVTEVAPPSHKFSGLPTGLVEGPDGAVYVSSDAGYLTTCLLYEGAVGPSIRANNGLLLPLIDPVYPWRIIALGSEVLPNGDYGDQDLISINTTMEVESAAFRTLPLIFGIVTGAVTFGNRLILIGYNPLAFDRNPVIVLVVRTMLSGFFIEKYAPVPAFETVAALFAVQGPELLLIGNGNPSVMACVFLGKPDNVTISSSRRRYVPSAPEDDVLRPAALAYDRRSGWAVLGSSGGYIHIFRPDDGHSVAVLPPLATSPRDALAIVMPVPPQPGSPLAAFPQPIPGARMAFLSSPQGKTEDILLLIRLDIANMSNRADAAHTDVLVGVSDAALLGNTLYSCELGPPVHVHAFHADTFRRLEPALELTPEFGMAYRLAAVAAPPRPDGGGGWPAGQLPHPASVGALLMTGAETYFTQGPGTGSGGPLNGVNKTAGSIAIIGVAPLRLLHQLLLPGANGPAQLLLVHRPPEQPADATGAATFTVFGCWGDLGLSTYLVKAEVTLRSDPAAATAAAAMTVVNAVERDRTAVRFVVPRYAVLSPSGRFVVIVGRTEALISGGEAATCWYDTNTLVQVTCVRILGGFGMLRGALALDEERLLIMTHSAPFRSAVLNVTIALAAAERADAMNVTLMENTNTVITRFDLPSLKGGGRLNSGFFWVPKPSNLAGLDFDVLAPTQDASCGAVPAYGSDGAAWRARPLMAVLVSRMSPGAMLIVRMCDLSTVFFLPLDAGIASLRGATYDAQRGVAYVLVGDSASPALLSSRMSFNADESMSLAEDLPSPLSTPIQVFTRDDGAYVYIVRSHLPPSVMRVLPGEPFPTASIRAGQIDLPDSLPIAAALLAPARDPSFPSIPPSSWLYIACSSRTPTSIVRGHPSLMYVVDRVELPSCIAPAGIDALTVDAPRFTLLASVGSVPARILSIRTWGGILPINSSAEAADGLPWALDPELAARDLVQGMAILPDGMTTVRSMVVHSATDSLYAAADIGTADPGRGVVLRFRLPDLTLLATVPLPAYATKPSMLLLDPPTAALLVSCDTMPAHIAVLAAAPPTPAVTGLRTGKQLPGAAGAVPAPPRTICSAVSAAFGMPSSSAGGAADSGSTSGSATGSSAAGFGGVGSACHLLTSAQVLVVDALSLFGSFVNASRDVTASVALLEPPVAVNYDRSRSVLRTLAVPRAASAWRDTPLRSAMPCAAFTCDAGSLFDSVSQAFAAGNLSIETVPIDKTANPPAPSCFCLLPQALRDDIARVSGGGGSPISAWRLQMSVQLPGRPGAAANATVIAGAPRLIHSSPPVIAAFLPAAAATAVSYGGEGGFGFGSDSGFASSLALIRADVCFSWNPAAAAAAAAASLALVMRLESQPRPGCDEPLLSEPCALVAAVDDATATALGTSQLVCAPPPPQTRFLGRTFDLQLLVGGSLVSVIPAAVSYAWPVLSGVDPLQGLPPDPSPATARALTVSFPPLAALFEVSAAATASTPLQLRVWVENAPCENPTLLNSRRSVRCTAPPGAGSGAGVLLEVTGADAAGRPFALNATSWEITAAAWRSSGSATLGGSDGSSAPSWGLAFYDGSPASLSPDPPLRGLGTLVSYAAPSVLTLTPDRLMLLPQGHPLSGGSASFAAADGVLVDGASVNLIIDASEPLPDLSSVTVALGGSSREGRCDALSRPSQRVLLCTVSAASLRAALGLRSSSSAAGPSEAASAQAAIAGGTVPLNISLTLATPGWPASTAVTLQAPPLRLYGRPCLASINPDSAAPGAVVQIYGSGFTTSGPGSPLPVLMPSVLFGTVVCADMTVVSETQLQCTVPPRDPAAAAAAGGYTRVDVTVTTAVGASNGVSFAYPSALEIKWTTPDNGGGGGASWGACGAAAFADGSAGSGGDGTVVVPLHLPGLSFLDPTPALEAVSGSVRSCQLSPSPQHADPAAAGDASFGVALKASGPFEAADSRVSFPLVAIASSAQLTPFSLSLYGWCFGPSGSIARTSGPRTWRISAPYLSWSLATSAAYASTPLLLLLPGSAVPGISLTVSVDALPGEAPSGPWDQNATVPAINAPGSTSSSAAVATTADVGIVQGITAVSRRLACTVAVLLQRNSSRSDPASSLTDAVTQLAVFPATAWTQYSFLDASAGSPGSLSFIAGGVGRHTAHAVFPDVSLAGAPLGATLQLRATCTWVPTGAVASVAEPLLLRTPAAAVSWAVPLPPILEPQAVVRPAPTVQLVSTAADASPLAFGGTLECTLSATAVHSARSGSSGGANSTASVAGNGELAEIVVAQRVAADLPAGALIGADVTSPAGGAAVAFTSFSIAARRLSLFNASVRCTLGSAQLPPLHALVRMAGCPPGREPAGSTGWLCTSCSAGEYSLGGASPCKKCPAKGATCGAGEMRPIQGYWRPPRDAAKPLTASSEVHVCANAEACALVQLPPLSVNSSAPVQAHHAVAQIIIHDPLSAAALAAAIQQAAAAADAAVDGDGEVAAAAAAAAVPSFIYGCAVDLGYAAGSPLCGVCATGYGLSGSVCRECWSAAAAGVIITLCILLALIAATWLALWHEPGDRSAAAIAFRQFFAFIQSLGVISAFRLQAMALLRAILNWTEVASAALLSAGPLSCAAPLPLLARYLTSLCLPLALLAAVAAIATIARLRKERRAARAAAAAAAVKAAEAAAAAAAEPNTTVAAEIILGDAVVALTGPPPLSLEPPAAPSSSAGSKRNVRASTALRTLSSRIVASSAAVTATSSDAAGIGLSDSPLNGEAAAASGSPVSPAAGGKPSGSPVSPAMMGLSSSSPTASPSSSPLAGPLSVAEGSPALVANASNAASGRAAAAAAAAAAGSKTRGATAAAAEARARARASSTLRFRLTSVGLLLLSLLYLPLLSASLRVLQCTAEPVDGRWYLLADLSVECYTGQHAVASAIAIAVLAILGVGFPALVLWKLSGRLPCVPQRFRDWSWSKVTSARRLRGRRGSMIAAEDTVWRPLKDGYRLQVQYFEAAVLARKGALAVAGGLLGDSVAGVAAVGVIAFAAAALQEGLQPYEDRIFNDSERASLVAVLAAVLLSLLYTADGAITPRNIAITIAIAAIAAGVTLLLAVRLARAGRTSARAALKRAKSLMSSRLLQPLKRSVSGQLVTRTASSGEISSVPAVSGAQRIALAAGIGASSGDAKSGPAAAASAATGAVVTRAATGAASDEGDAAIVTANPLSCMASAGATADSTGAGACALADAAAVSAGASRVARASRLSRPRFSIGGVTIGGAGTSRDADAAAAAGMASAGAEAAAAAAHNRAARTSAVKRMSLVAAHLLVSQFGVPVPLDVDVAAAAALSDAPRHRDDRDDHDGDGDDDGRGSRSGSDDDGDVDHESSHGHGRRSS